MQLQSCQNLKSEWLLSLFHEYGSLFHEYGTTIVKMNVAKSCLFVQGILTLAEQQKLLAELDGDPTVVANLGLSPSKLPVSSRKFAINFSHLDFFVYSVSFAALAIFLLFIINARVLWLSCVPNYNIILFFFFDTEVLFKE